MLLTYQQVRLSDAANSSYFYLTKPLLLFSFTIPVTVKFHSTHILRSKFQHVPNNSNSRLTLIEELCVKGILLVWFYRKVNIFFYPKHLHMLSRSTRYFDPRKGSYCNCTALHLKSRWPEFNFHQWSSLYCFIPSYFYHILSIHTYFVHRKKL